MLQEGDVIEIKREMRVYADVPEHFVHPNKQGCFDMIHADVILGRDLEYLCGKYIVYKTTSDEGPSNFDGAFPGGDELHHALRINGLPRYGYHVFCVKADNEKIKVDFYQSGHFSAMIKDIQPVGRATLHWEYEEED